VEQRVIIDIDSGGDRSPCEQILEQVRAAIARGGLRAGERLPSVRGLAQQARVNPNTVAKAYRELEWSGLVVTRPGDGVFVADGAVAKCRSSARSTALERLDRALDEALATGLAADDLERRVARHLARTEVPR
jgi:GntR family transcriptional regulator